jgi:hypothetical protein
MTPGEKVSFELIGCSLNKGRVTLEPTVTYTSSDSGLDFTDKASLITVIEKVCSSDPDCNSPPECKKLPGTCTNDECIYENEDEGTSCAGGTCDDTGNCIETVWWNPDWNYYKEIALTENSGNDLADYQVKLDITADNMEADCKDLRFIDESDSQLSYWIESCSAPSATVWVKIPSISASSEEVIFMYYGNSGATSESDPTNVFDLYDDFERASLGSDWIGYGDTGPWSIDSGRLKVADIDDVDYSYLYNNKKTFDNTEGFVLDSKIYFASSTQWGGFIIWSYSGSHHHIDFNPSRYSDRATSTAKEEPETPPVSTNTWYDVKLIYDASTYTLSWYNNNNFAYEDSLTGTSAPTSGYIGVISNYYYGYILWDYIRVRKYVSSEPTYWIGSEFPPS